ncbi:hypothetical protein [Salinibaculum rarum]|jgi:predicted RNA-binding Zn-ribbon protein involved in translation (DUF1610 family)|uniref:hypothetical protein n=1 Tax=Salinibaculum rarum TaxID=3058903 RepID=UPI00265E51A2|nr:hypothetical protein [Salinibaculum sp. KK48]
MTRVYSTSRAGSVPETPSHRVHRKSTLFCPRCGHDAPVDGDWVLTLRPETVDVDCPDCRTTLTARPYGLAAKERSARSR